MKPGRSEGPERARLKRAVGERPVTFVLGAGVSRSLGVPDWRALTRLLWSKAHGAERLPSFLRDEHAALERTVEWAKKNEGDAFATRLCLSTVHPLADQMALELVKLVLDEKDERAFAAHIRSALYPKSARAPGPGDTLGVLARLLVAEQTAARRRVVRVITLNADDHLETAANRGHSALRDPVLWPIARESGHPRASNGAGGKPPIPVYHVHGFLPREGSAPKWRDAPDTLVFTDSEYWATVASPLSFANRVFAQALHDSSCVFVGVSMTDVNLIRWLGARYNAICDDKREQARTVGSRERREKTRGSMRAALARHFWIRPSDPERVVGDLLRERGVTSVPIEHWGQPFERLVFECFGRDASNSRAGLRRPRRAARARRRPTG